MRQPEIEAMDREELELLQLERLQATDAGYGTVLLGGALVAGLSIAGGGWVSGMVIQAQGQIIHSMLDTAVNTSPLLDNPAKAQFLGSPEAKSGLIVRHETGF